MNVRYCKAKQVKAFLIDVQKIYLDNMTTYVEKYEHMRRGLKRNITLKNICILEVTF